jgi:hypothetical protein
MLKCKIYQQITIQNKHYLFSIRSDDSKKLSPEFLSVLNPNSWVLSRGSSELDPIFRELWTN